MKAAASCMDLGPKNDVCSGEVPEKCHHGTGLLMIEIVRYANNDNNRKARNGDAMADSMLRQPPHASSPPIRMTAFAGGAEASTVSEGGYPIIFRAWVSSRVEFMDVE
jgi:hypothetical protein